jgi:hypothetical protein
MAHHRNRRSSCQLQTYREPLTQGAPFPITRLLSVADVEEAVAAEGGSFRDRIFTPAITIWILLGQILDADHSCQQALLRFVAWLRAAGRWCCSSATGAYCKARQRLPEGVLTRLVRRTGQRGEQQSPHEWHWFGRRVRVVDGTTVSMPDTEPNQKVYPQSRTQKPGLGFPIARVLVIWSLAVGTVLEAAVNPYPGKETGETAMLRSLMDSLQRGDVLLGDRYFANYWIIAVAKLLGIDVVFRQHQRRRVDFRTGRRLGRDDHVITWTRPKRPSWMTQAFYDTLPTTLTVRELRVRIPKGKNRERTIVVVTTLVDAGRYAKGELATLYRRRWQAELHVRSLKTTMQMDILRCKTPAMVRKEIWAHFLVFNLIRTAMAEAAQRQASPPWQLSFKGSLQALRAFGGFWPSGRLTDPDDYYAAMLDAIAEHRVGHRPDRVEPRAIKRRPKPQRLLQEPRVQARARLRAGNGS